MALPAGVRLGPYEVVAPIGAGGMGEVYRARDPRLGREVAIKVLAPHLAQDRDALARFEREAKTASALNHPQIVHIYDIGEAATPAGPVHYIAMELVEGETLRARLQAGARIGALLEPLVLTAEALARAHRAGIVHRDLKPENIMITADGYPKILDFGLAKLQDPGLQPGDPELDPTAALAGRTRTGAVLGTPGYMSPEQVRGKAADHRSDIFSYGCILYEASTGRQPFRGASTVATLHAVAYEDPPPIERISPETPEAFRRVIARCLEKDPERRYQAIKDVGDELRASGRPGAGAALETLPTQALPGSIAGNALRGRRLAAVGVALLALAGATVFLLARWKAPAEPPALPRAALKIEKLTNRGDVETTVLSPDGRYLAFTTRAGPEVVWLKDLVEKTEARLVTLAAGQRILILRFARDGRSLLYRSSNPTLTMDRALYRIPLIGGEPRVISSDVLVVVAPDERRTAFRRMENGKWQTWIADVEGGAEKQVEASDGGLISWSPDSSSLLFNRNRGRSLVLVNADGGAERRLADLADVAGAAYWKPDGSAAIVRTRSGETTVKLVAVDIASGTAKTLGGRSWSDVSELVWLPDATGVVFVASEAGRRTIWSMSYPAGLAAPLPAGTPEYTSLGMTADGTALVARQTVARADILVSARPEDGAFKKAVSGTDLDYDLCWSADGQIVYTSNEAGSYDLFAADPDGGRRRQLTFDRKANERAPAASPDGRYIVFVSDRSGRLALERINRDGSGLTSLTSPSSGRGDHTPHVSPDSRWVFYRGWDNGPTLWKVAIDGGTPQLVLGARTGPIEEKAFGASVSPDGASLAFFYFSVDRRTGNYSPTQLAVSTIDGRLVKTFPYTAMLSLVGEHQRVQWSRNGTALYYHQVGNPATLWRRPLAGGAPVQVSRFEDDLYDFEWAPDGKTLACSRRSQVSDAVLITNFR